MKKMIVALVVLLLTAPAWAVVDINCTTDGNEVTVTYDASGESSLVRAFALDITVDTGATIDLVVDVTTDYIIHPGTIIISGGVVTDYGLPVAPATDVDALGGIGTGGMTIEEGSLYVGAPNAPGTSGTLLTFKVSGDCNVVITENATRGGVVLEDGTTPGINAPGCEVRLACLRAGLTVGGVLITPAMVTLWESLGSPLCWCYECHSKADTDNDCDVDYSDAMVFIAGYSTYANGVCADTDNDGDVDYTDAMSFIDGYSNGCGTCSPI